MSIIIHRCTTCTHLAMFHDGATCLHCPCRTGAVPGESEVMPTWDDMGAPVSTVSEPGTRWSQIPLCNCDDCNNLYRELVSA
jgi:hypothetical protein